MQHHDICRKSVLIVGVGNLLLRDEGVGVHVIRRLQEMSLPDHVELLDGATCGLDLLHYFGDREKIILIDAVLLDLQPGSIVRFTGEDFITSNESRWSAHDSNLAEVIQHARRLLSLSRVVVYGVVPLDCSSPCIGLTLRVEETIPRLLAQLLQEIDGE